MKRAGVRHAAQYDLAVITVIADNGLYGTIRMHQEREYPGRVSATILKNPDFVAYARAFAASAWWWRRRRIFPRRSRRRRLGQAGRDRAADRSEAITPGMTLAKIGAAARAKQKRC